MPRMTHGSKVSLEAVQAAVTAISALNNGIANPIVLAAPRRLTEFGYMFEDLQADPANLLPQGSTAILITPTTRPDLLQAVDDLLLRYLAPVVVLLDSKSFGGPSGTQKLIDSLHERRVPVIPVSCDDNLSQSLSVLSADIRLQEINLWQTPAYAQST